MWWNLFGPEDVMARGAIKLQKRTDGVCSIQSAEPSLLLWCSILAYLSPRDIASAALTSIVVSKAAGVVTKSRAADAARGVEDYQVPFINEVTEEPYVYFEYVRHCIKGIVGMSVSGAALGRSGHDKQIAGEKRNTGGAEQSYNKQQLSRANVEKEEANLEQTCYEEEHFQVRPWGGYPCGDNLSYLFVTVDQNLSLVGNYPSLNESHGNSEDSEHSYLEKRVHVNIGMDARNSIPRTVSQQETFGRRAFLDGVVTGEGCTCGQVSPTTKRSANAHQSSFSDVSGASRASTAPGRNLVPAALPLSCCRCSTCICGVSLESESAHAISGPSRVPLEASECEELVVDSAGKATESSDTMKYDPHPLSSTYLGGNSVGAYSSASEKGEYCLKGRGETSDSSRQTEDDDSEDGWQDETDFVNAVECGPACNCGRQCPKRASQSGVGLQLKIVRHATKGWGLHAAQDIPKRAFVCEYAGELLTTQEAKARHALYDALAGRATSSAKSKYLMVVKEHLPSGELSLRTNIDPTYIGNVGRFINHSCDGGNLLPCIIRSTSYPIPRVGFFARRFIHTNEELTYSYGQVEIGALKQLSKCVCGLSACSGFLPSELT
eukprot:jgi/Mesen1/8977/ME000056S08386